LATAYPRYSPDGQNDRIRSHQPDRSVGDLQVARARGIPLDVWLVHADGSDLRQGSRRAERRPIDRMVARWVAASCLRWWGSYLVDVPSGNSSLLSFLPGYGALAWLSD